MGNSVVIASILDALIRLRVCDGGSECLGKYAAILCFCLWCCDAALGCFIQAAYSYRLLTDRTRITLCTKNNR